MSEKQQGIKIIFTPETKIFPWFGKHTLRGTLKPIEIIDSKGKTTEITVEVESLTTEFGGLWIFLEGYTFMSSSEGSRRDFITIVPNEDLGVSIKRAQGIPKNTIY